MEQNIKLLYPYPKLNGSWITKLERLLQEELGLNQLPEDYKAFLLRSNGGIISPNILNEDESENKEVVKFKSSLMTKDNAFVCPSLIMMYVVWLEEEMMPLYDEIEYWNMRWVKESNIAYSRENPDILPDQMLCIGLCNKRDDKDVIALSLAEQDYGSIYYFDSRVKSCPKLFGDFFKKRIDDIYKHYNIDKNTNLNSEEYIEIRSAIKQAYFVKVADSFDSFWKSLYIEASI
ncbi:SMI1/KNR4 family protein [Myroides injenensis]|uniref:SMI1/KNR4 family protein n=1 Tax=Myroides injenensis TaxID=1183151 RepID=UPI0022703D0E|nr:SMI1/KNR4 family protein [Myroides injenensis]